MAREYFVCPECKVEVDPETSNFCPKCGINLLNFDRILKHIDYYRIDYCFFCEQPGITSEQFAHFYTSDWWYTPKPYPEFLVSYFVSLRSMYICYLPSLTIIENNIINLNGDQEPEPQQNSSCIYYKCRCCHCDKEYYVNRIWIYEGQDNKSKCYDIVKDLNLHEIGEIQEEGSKIKFIRRC